jgi:predicted phosphodiesterase
MKLGLISDIHGNYEALKVVLAELERMDVDEVFCLGDVVGYYPQINECCEALRKRGIKSLMGNHDWYLSGGGFCPRSKSVNDCLVYQRAIIRADNLEWVRGFMTHARFGRLSLVHGGWSDPIDEYLIHPRNISTESKAIFSRLVTRTFNPYTHGIEKLTAIQGL